MASLKVINSVKYSKALLRLYTFCGNAAVRFLKCFLKTDPKLIVFVSAGGKLMTDSPKCIYEKMRNDSRFSDYKFVWAFRDVTKFDVPVGHKIQLDSLAYYINVLKARVWITNVSMTRGLSFSGIHTFTLNTWHGSAIKMIGADVTNKPNAFTVSRKKSRRQNKNELLFLAQGDHDVEVWQRGLQVPKESICCIGLPRNDDLVKSNTPDIVKELKQKIGLPTNKKIILYAPTFRDYEKKGGKYLVLSPPVDFDKWKMNLGNDYILLFRAHPSVVEVMNISDDNPFVKNVSAYPVVNDLMLVSDIMISDYSSILFDYSILGRPMLSFAYDYDAYTRERGVYFDIRKELDCMRIDNEDSLLDEIKHMDIDKRKRIAVNFKNKYVQYYGNATEKAVDIIYGRIKEG